MSGMFWFGTRLNQQLVPLYAGAGDGSDLSRTGYNAETAYTNGGASVRNSVAGHMVYNMTWTPTKKRDDLRPFLDYADGLYDTTDGTNLLFFIDPTAADRNVAPSAWAFPAQAARDAMPMISGATGPIRPTVSVTPANALGYPARSAVYTIAGTETARKLYIPIPPGTCAWVGAAGSKTGATGVQVTPFTGAAAGTIAPLTLLSVTNSTRFSASFSSASGYTGLEVQITIAAGVLTFSGLSIQILPIGATPLNGNFISGQGHSGCEFSGKPVQSPYQIAGPNAENVGMTARLVETGDWI